MMDDGVKEKGRDEDVKVQDIAELLLEAIETGERAPAPRHRGLPARRLGLTPASSAAEAVGDVVVDQPGRLHERVRSWSGRRTGSRAA